MLKKGLKSIHSVLNWRLSAQDILDVVGLDEKNVKEYIEEAHLRALEKNQRMPDIPDDISEHDMLELVGVLFCSCWSQNFEQIMNLAYHICVAVPMIKAANEE